MIEIVEEEDGGMICIEQMYTNDFCDYDTIHRFDPPDEHMGGAGNASNLF